MGSPFLGNIDYYLEKRVHLEANILPRNVLSKKILMSIGFRHLMIATIYETAITFDWTSGQSYKIFYARKFGF